MIRIISLIFFIFLLLVLVALAYFNSEPVLFDYLFGKTELPLSILLLLCFILGVIVASSFYATKIYRQKRQLKQLKSARKHV